MTSDNIFRPEVSVVLPVYNGEKHLAQAVESILAQTFPNFELIMIDDGSTDDSPFILRHFEEADSRVRLVIRENRGLAITLNDSLDLARGQWIARMDQDDIAVPKRFEIQLKWIKQTGADICGSWVKRFGSLDNRTVRLPQSDEEIKMGLLFGSPLAHPTVMMRSSSVGRLRYDEDFEKAEDYDLWERAAEAGLKMANVPDVLLLYRVHGKQISIQAANRQIEQAQRIRRRYWEFQSKSKALDSKSIDETLKLFSQPANSIDFDIVDTTFERLISSNTEKTRRFIFRNLKPIYLKHAWIHSDIGDRWVKLNHLAGESVGLFARTQFLIFRLFRINPNNNIYKIIRKIIIMTGSVKA